MAVDTPTMNEVSSLFLSLSQSHEAHKASSQHTTSLTLPHQPLYQSNGMERTTSPTRSSSPDSTSSIECILSPPSSPSSTYPSYLLPYLLPMSPQERETFATSYPARRLAEEISRLEACQSPSQIIARAEKRLKKEQRKRSETFVIKEACIKCELKRAKNPAILPTTFETIDIHIDLDEESRYCERSIVTQDSEMTAETSTTRIKAFVGLITIQDRLSAMRQALAEHAKDKTLRKELGRHSFHVDASVSCEYGITGTAVVHKSHRQDWASSWTAKGYRIHEALDHEDAEGWAIWQALQVVLDTVHDDRARSKPQDPCSLAVVYSDCARMLKRIDSGTPNGGKVVHNIIAKSVELQKFGVEIHLHWVPGHTNVPGNELAIRVAQKAQQPVK